MLGHETTASQQAPEHSCCCSAAKGDAAWRHRGLTEHRTRLTLVSGSRARATGSRYFGAYSRAIGLVPQPDLRDVGYSPSPQA